MDAKGGAKSIALKGRMMSTRYTVQHQANKACHHMFLGKNFQTLHFRVFQSKNFNLISTRLVGNVTTC
jgi:hypothetical protein